MLFTLTKMVRNLLGKIASNRLGIYLGIWNIPNLASTMQQWLQLRLDYILTLEFAPLTRFVVCLAPGIDG
jgi:hypothetical protein